MIDYLNWTAKYYFKSSHVSPLRKSRVAIAVFLAIGGSK